MEGELNNFLRLFVLTVVSLLYCYFIAAKIPKGFLRLLFVFPVIILLVILPFSIHSFHIGATAWSYLGWFCNFKLLLFAFDEGPLSAALSSSSSSLSLWDVLHFLATAAFPFKINQNPPKAMSKPVIIPSSVLEASNKATLLALLFYSYNYKQYFPQHVLLILYFFHTYLTIQLCLAIGAIPAQVILGLDVEPQFNAPLLSTSLQNFWGQRWNRRVSDIHRATVYDPVRRISTRIIGPRWASLPAVFATFVVSGLLHELLYYHMTREFPTWEVTWFFVLQGIFVDIEIILKKKLVATNKLRLHRAVSGPLALATLAVTAGCLSYRQILRNGTDEKIIKEFNQFVNLLKGTA